MNRRISTSLAAIALILLSLQSIAAPRSAHAGERCSEQTNHCIGGRFLQYWEQNGGLAVFGHPITPAREERNRDTGKTYLTQWFERNRFELHPENQPPYDVLLGRLGEDNLITAGRDWRTEYKAERPEDADCEQRTTDGKVFLLCGPMRAYYKTHGLEFDGRPGFSEAESLALFGLPLTQPKMETNSSGDRVLTQWFERTRMEFHPTKPEPYKLLLGLLGNDARADNPRPAPRPANRPAITVVDVDGTVYEHGTNGQATRLGTTPNLGRVLDAVRVGPTVIILREQGLQMVEGGVGRNIATFTKGKAEFGQLVKGFSSDVVVYSYRRSAPRAPFGFEGIVGVIGNGTARKVSDTLRNPLALGLTANGRGIYIIEQGQDPSFAEVKVVAIDDGRTLATLPIAGVGGGMLAPDRQMMVTVDQPREHPDTLIFWDLNNQTGAPRNVIPQPGRDIRSLIWAPNSRVVYAGIYPSASEANGQLWRVDPMTRRSEIVVRDFPHGAIPVKISDDGRYLITQVAMPNLQGTFIYDLQTGNRQSVAFPIESVIAR